MTVRPTSNVKRDPERGSALLGVMLLLMLMSALAAALAVSGETETMISRNQTSGAKAQAAAEAGLSHAVELATTFIFEWKNNSFGSADDAIDALLAGVENDLVTSVGAPGALGVRTGIALGEQIASGDTVSIVGAQAVGYSAFITDDDDTAPAAKPENSPEDVTNDINQVLIVRATGIGPDKTTVTVEAMISAFPFPAIATNDDLKLSGSFSVLGSSGGVHTNSDLQGDGNAGTIDEMATATGDYDYSDPDIEGFGGAPRMPIPPIAASDYFSLADYILKADGTKIIAATGAACLAPCSDWSFSGGEWRINGGGSDGIYYSETTVEIKGNTGPVNMTVISEGSIKVSGGPQLNPAPEKNLLFVADGDVKMSGNPGSTFVGKILAHEQIDIAGNSTVTAMIMAEDAADDHTEVTENKIHGSVVVIYDGGLNDDVFTVSGWRDVR